MRLRYKSWTGQPGFVALSALACTALCVAFTLRAGTNARAQPGPPQAPTTQCSLRGEDVLPEKVSILNALGQPIARFSGAPTPLIASDFPSDAQGKVHIETGTGAGSFRIRGYLNPAELPLFTATNVTVSPAHVWLAANRGVTLVGSASGRLQVELKAVTPLQQTFRAAGVCSAFSLERGSPTGFTPASSARGYELKEESLDLYGAPGADTPVSTLHRSPYVEGVLFLGSERHAGFVHLEYHADIVVDAWARVSALSALPPGETLDQLAPAATQRSAPKPSSCGRAKKCRYGVSQKRANLPSA
jgi:hypothetical protein